MKRIIPILLALSATTALSKDTGPFTNLAIEGGGVRGIAFTGAIKAMDSLGILQSVQRVAGSSAGAIQATLLATGHTPDEIMQLLSDLKFEHFNDGGFFFIGGGVRMGQHFGYYKGEKINSWIGQRLMDKTGTPDITFAGLDTLAKKDKKYRQLFVVVSNLSIQAPWVLCARTFPNMKIRDAVQASCCIPFYYEPVVIDSTGQRFPDGSTGPGTHILVDGGLLANLPFFVFDTLPGKTLGLMLDRPEQAEHWQQAKQGPARFDIKNLGDFTEACYNAVLDMQTANLGKQVLQTQVIHISTGNIGPRVKHMHKKEVDMLVNNGKTAVEYFAK